MRLAIAIFLLIVFAAPLPFALYIALHFFSNLQQPWMLAGSSARVFYSLALNLLAATYPFAYALSLGMTISRRTLSIYSFAPVALIVLLLIIFIIGGLSGTIWQAK